MKMQTRRDELIDADLQKGLVGPRALADMLDCHIDTLRRWRRQGRITARAYVVIADGTYRYSLEAVLTDLQNR